MFLQCEQDTFPMLLEVCRGWPGFPCLLSTPAVPTPTCPLSSLHARGPLHQAFAHRSSPPALFTGVSYSSSAGVIPWEDHPEHSVQVY